MVILKVSPYSKLCLSDNKIINHKAAKKLLYYVSKRKKKIYSEITTFDLLSVAVGV